MVLLNIGSLFVAALLVFALMMHAVHAQNCTSGVYTPQVNCSSPVIIPCDPGFLCLEDRLPERCPKGYYCPNGTVALKCPKGKYCVKGSGSPRDCPALSFCPEGSYRYFHYGSFLGFAVILAILIGAKITFNRLREASRSAEVGSTQDRPPQGFVDLTFRNIEVKLGKKVLVAHASGKFAHGRVGVIMGPSGAGKSTLMNVLSGKLDPTSGAILINGGADSLLRYRRVMGFVPQDDILLPTLTVEDAIRHSADTRLPAEWTKTQRLQLVNEVIEVLGLQRVRHTRIGDVSKRGISGGERKRVNIGVELAASPAVLLLDEPTSGLDAAASAEVMTHLQSLATKFGVCVVAVLHQPRFEMLQGDQTDVLLLAPGGRTVFLGSADAAVAHFDSIGYACPATMNPADHWLDLIAGRLPNSEKRVLNAEELQQAWELRASASKKVILLEPMEIESPEQCRTARGFASFFTGPGEPADPTLRRVTPNFGRQLGLFLRRAAIQLMQSWSLPMLDLLVHLLAGLIVAIPFAARATFLPPISNQYWKNGLCPEGVNRYFCQYPEADSIGNMGAYIVMAMGLVAVTISVRNFHPERNVYWREAASSVNTLAYFVAKNLIEIPFILMNVLAFLCAFYLVSPPAGNFGWHYLLLVLFEIVSYGVGYVTSMMLPTQQLAALLGAVAALLSGLGTGGVTGVRKMGLMGYFAWSRWYGEAFFISELRLPLWPKESHEEILNYIDKFDRYQYKLSNRGEDILALIIFALVLRTMAYVLMRALNRDKQK